MSFSMQGWIIALWVGALGAFLAVGVGLYSVWRTPPPVNHVAVEVEGAELELVWVGDIMVGDASQPFAERHGYDWPFEHVRQLADGDLVIGNAESVITERTDPFDPSQHWHYNSLPPAAGAYAEAGIDVLGMANNHIMDRGPEGLRDMMRHSDEAGLHTFGAGMNVQEAEKPLLIESSAGTVGVVGLGKYYGPHKMAKADQAGTIALSRASIERGYDLAKRAGADWVVAYVQWGRAYAHLTREQEDFAREFAAAGYDLVIGHHPHVVQPISFVDGMPVVYSVGNFVFGTPGRFTSELPGFGLVVTTEFSPDGLTELAVRCIVTDNTVVDFQPTPCSEEESSEVLGSLHSDLEVEGDVGRLNLEPMQHAAP
jgi:poly-gamma-glutamate capsule biosynthesis protein CapA/YwtB (metallophosphatase superfamily)